MNLRFNDSILCEIQLAVNSKTSNFIKCSNMLHHYIYELERSLFGPITELGSIWNSLDNRSKIYEQLVKEEDSRITTKTQHSCIDQINFVAYEQSFICSSCKGTYCHNRFIKSHLQCKTCSYFFCAKCQIKAEDSS
jgi:hypothetical protein